MDNLQIGVVAAGRENLGLALELAFGSHGSFTDEATHFSKDDQNGMVFYRRKPMPGDNLPKGVDLVNIQKLANNFDAFAAAEAVWKWIVDLATDKGRYARYAGPEPSDCDMFQRGAFSVKRSSGFGPIIACIKPEYAEISK